MDDTVQAEALPPDTLANEVRQVIESVVDLDLIEVMETRGRLERQRILDAIDGLAV